jgi:hypothetical protein
MRKKFIITSFLLLLFWLMNLFFFYSLIIKEENNKIAGIQSKQENIEVSAFIGEHRFTLFGYTSPEALVSFQGLGIFDQTYADKQGYFIFQNRFSPFSPREACLTAQDKFGRLTSPVCLPPFPTDYNVEIGPVIMPPTLSLDKNDYWVGDEVILSGQTIPETEVDLSMFTKQSNFLALNLIKKVEAFALPEFKTQSDQQGNFSIALPSSSAQTFRLFAQSQFLKAKSPESRKLTVKILPWWFIIVKIFGLLFSLIKSRLLEFLILAEIIALIIYILRRYLAFHVIKKERAIVLRENFSLMIKDNEKRSLIKSSFNW